MIVKKKKKERKEKKEDDDTNPELLLDPRPKACKYKNVRDILHHCMPMFLATDIPQDASIIVYGRRRAGKTTFVTWFVYWNQYKFDDAYVLQPSMATINSLSCLITYSPHSTKKYCK